MKKILIIAVILQLFLTGCTDSNETESLSLTDQAPFVKISETDYEGEVIVSGKYSVLKPNTLMGGIVCFYPDETTSYLIPDQSEASVPWFCFSNHQEAKESLEIDDLLFEDECAEKITGEAIVKISNYEVFIRESAGSDKATLEEVLSITREPSVEGCD